MKFLAAIAMMGFCVCAFPQSASLLVGAAGNGMGNATSCSGNEWSLLNNIGGLSEVKKTTIAVTHAVHPGFKPFNRSAIVMASPLAGGTAGLSLFRFGDDLYGEQIITAGFSNELGIASLGVALRYIQYRGEAFGTRGVFAVSFGGIAKISKVMRFGAYITNINQPEISHLNKQTVPARVATGVAFLLSEAVTTAVEVEKELGAPVTIKTGVSYTFADKAVFRTGFNIDPDAAFVGIGIKPRRMSLDYAAEYQLATGLLHQLSIGYHFLKK
jgi:hypothetical protein